VSIVTGPKFYIVYFLNESFWKFSFAPLQSICYRVVLLQLRKIDAGFSSRRPGFVARAYPFGNYVGECGTGTGFCPYPSVFLCRF